MDAEKLLESFNGHELIEIAETLPDVLEKRGLTLPDYMGSVAIETGALDMPRATSETTPPAETTLSPETEAFKAEQIDHLAQSGWNTAPSIREGLEKVGLAVPTAEFLETFSAGTWEQLRQDAAGLRKQFEDAKFFNPKDVGVLLIPNLGKLDTRAAIGPAIRRNQSGHYKKGGSDYVNPSLPAGAAVTAGNHDWLPVATFTGPSGIYLGSYNKVRDDKDAAAYTVDGIDTREFMIRQIWGATVLQAGTELPDSNTRTPWTWTVFPGEDKAAGDAPAGNVSVGQVGFFLYPPGYRDGGIVRVRPAVVRPDILAL